MRRLALLFIACSKATATLPDGFAGSYTHTTVQHSGLVQQEIVDQLDVTSSGIVMVDAGPTLTDVFTEVSCGSATSCRFKTRQRCEGTVEKNADGSLTVIASGACTEWSGSYNR